MSRKAGVPEAEAAGLKPGAGMIRRLHDYQVEHMLYDCRGASCPAKSGPTALPRWRQQAQYAAGHTLNDFYSLPPEVRRQTPIQPILHRRWPPNGGAFLSPAHSREIQSSVADGLISVIAGSHTGEVPLMLYEQWHVPVPALGLELSMIVQLAWASPAKPGTVVIEKFMVGMDENVVQAFVHMCHVFCVEAFGCPPSSIEICSLLGGERRIYEPDANSYRESLDYVRLLALMMEEVQEERRPVMGRSHSGEEAYGRGLVM